MDVMERRREMIPLSGGGTPGYVQNGLFFWLDGIDNTRNGHDASASSWENLVGSESIALTNATIMQDSVQFSTSSLGVGSISKTLTTYTVEITLNISSTSNDWLGVGLFGSNTYRVMLPYRWNIYYAYYKNGSQLALQSLPSSQLISLSLMVDGTTERLYQDGTLLASGNVGVGSQTIDQLRLNTMDGSTGKGSVSIYSVRLYDRALTGDEVAQNHSYDKSRFEWDYVWDYLNGISMTADGWTLASNGGGACDLRATGQLLASQLGNSYRSLRRPDLFNVPKGVMEVKFYITGVAPGDSNQNTRICLSNGTKGIQICTTNSEFCLMESPLVTLGASIVANQIYTLRLTLDGSYGAVAVDGVTLASMVDINSILYAANTSIWSQNADWWSTYVQSVKLKLNRTN